MKKKFLVLLGFIMAVSVFVSANCAYALPKTEESFRKIQIDNPKILKEQAVISYKKGNYQEALTYLENITQNSIDEESLLLLSNCYDSLGNNAKAIYYIRQAIDMNSKSAYAYYNLGILKFKEGAVSEALDCFNKATKLNKSFSPAFYNAGNCAYMNKEFKKALKYYQEALRANPENPNIYHNIALTYEMLGDKKNSDKYKSLYQNLNSGNAQ